jgi:hypothetical protein
VLTGIQSISGTQRVVRKFVERLNLEVGNENLERSSDVSITFAPPLKLDDCHIFVFHARTSHARLGLGFRV